MRTSLSLACAILLFACNYHHPQCTAEEAVGKWAVEFASPCGNELVVFKIEVRDDQILLWSSPAQAWRKVRLYNWGTECVLRFERETPSSLDVGELHLYQEDGYRVAGFGERSAAGCKAPFTASGAVTAGSGVYTDSQ